MEFIQLLTRIVKIQVQNIIIRAQHKKTSPLYILII